MSNIKKITLLVLTVTGLLFATGCEEKTAQEKAKESMQKAAEDMQDALKDSAEKTEKAVNDAMKDK